MIKCAVIQEFTLERFDELKNIQRKSINTKGKLYVGDIFECTEEMAKYLIGDNKDKHVVVKVIEVEPEEDITETIIDVRSEEVKEILNDKIDKIEKMIKPKKKKPSKK